MRKNIVDGTLDQLIQLGILEKNENMYKITPIWQARINGCANKLVEQPDYFRKIQEEFPNETEYQLAQRTFQMAEITILTDVLRGIIKNKELVNCIEVIGMIRKINSEKIMTTSLQNYGSVSEEGK